MVDAYRVRRDAFVTALLKHELIEAVPVRHLSARTTALRRQVADLTPALEACVILALLACAAQAGSHGAWLLVTVWVGLALAVWLWSTRLVESTVLRGLVIDTRGTLEAGALATLLERATSLALVAGSALAGPSGATWREDVIATATSAEQLIAEGARRARRGAGGFVCAGEVSELALGVVSTILTLERLAEGCPVDLGKRRQANLAAAHRPGRPAQVA